jgi:hypothetical protein
MLSRPKLLAPLAAAVALAAAAPAADAASYKSPTSYARLQGVGVPVVPAIHGGCANTNGGTDIEGVGRANGNDIYSCGYGLTYIGPATSIASVVGPTIISPGFVGTVITSTGNIVLP